MISDTYGYLFVLVPRTACTATSLALHEHNGGHAVWLPPRDVVDDDGNVVVERKHSTVGELIEHDLIDQDRVAKLLTFGAVRNPFDSLVSFYHKLRNQYVPLLDDPDAFIHRNPRMKADMAFVADHDFSTWVLEKYGRAWFDRGHHLYERWIGDLDVILRFENLQDDLDAVLGRVGAPHVEIPVHNVTEGRDPDYRTYYTRAARRAVARYFSADLKRFGYRF